MKYFHLLVRKKSVGIAVSPKICNDGIKTDGSVAKHAGCLSFFRNKSKTARHGFMNTGKVKSFSLKCDGACRNCS